jgi:Bacterial PH domain/Short C-terminal domain
MPAGRGRSAGEPGIGLEEFEVMKSARRDGTDAVSEISAGDDGLRPDIQRAWDALPGRLRLGKKRDVKKLVEHLHDGEVVEEMAGGLNGGNQGLLVATNRRALFISEGVIKHSFEDFPYDRITSITSSRGMALAKITVMAAGASRVIEQMDPASAQRVADHIRAAVERAGRPVQQVQMPPVQVPAQAPDGIMEKLQKLGDLRDKGIVTQEEFDEKKAELLQRL